MARVAAAEDDHWWYRHTRAVMRDTLEPWLTTPIRCLDAGCGPGGNTAWLSTYGPVVGADPSADAVRFVRQRRADTRPVQARIDALPFADAAFDLVVVVTVLFLVPDHARAAAEVHRVLRPGGTAWFLEPALPFLRRSHDAVNGAIRRYRLRDLTDLVEGAGLTVRRATYAHAYLVPPAALLAGLYRLRPAPPERANSDLDRSRFPSVFTRLTALERRLLSKTDLPFGVSALAVAERT
jgi:SAM-dependent methyltransferase